MTPVRGPSSTKLTDAEVIAYAIAACESLVDDQTFGPMARIIDVRRDVPPEVRDGQQADYKSAVFTISSCLRHSVGSRSLPTDIETLLRQGMDDYPGHRPSPELFANEMRRTAMRLSIGLPDSRAPSASTSTPHRPPKRTVSAPPPRPDAPVAERSSGSEPSSGSDTPSDSEPVPTRAAKPVRVAAAPRTAAERTPAPRTPRGPRRILLTVLGVAAVIAVVVVSVHLFGGSDTAHPITAKAATGAALRVRKIGLEAGPNGQTQVKISPAIESKLRNAMTLPSGPGGRLMLLTDPLPGEWKPSVNPSSDVVQLPLDASTFGSTRSGAVTGIPANPASRPSTFTDANGNKQQTLVTTMKDHALAAGATLPNTDDKDVLVYDVPNGTSILAFALVGDDDFVIASTLRSSMPPQSDPSSF
jgi:hypothetical protein